MNQILNPEHLVQDEVPEDSYYTKYSKPRFHINNTFYKIQFVVSFFIASCFIIVFFVRINKFNKNEKLARDLLDVYKTSTLYSNNTEYSAKLLDNSFNNTLNSTTPFVIGMIKIDKIDVNYPIIHQTNRDLLRIAPCRFAGPMPNEVR